MVKSKKLIHSGGSFTPSCFVDWGTTVSLKLIFRCGVFDTGFFGDGLHFGISFDEDWAAIVEHRRNTLFFEDDLDAAVVAIFKDNGVADVDEDDGDLTRFPDTTAQDSNKGSQYNISILFFLPMFAFVMPPFVVDQQLFDFAMIVDVLFWIVI